MMSSLQAPWPEQDVRAWIARSAWRGRPGFRLAVCLPDGALIPAYSGVRPKIHGPGEPAPDFRIDGPARHGLPGLVNLFGIESPGLTSSLALAEVVAAVLAD